MFPHGLGKRSGLHIFLLCQLGLQKSTKGNLQTMLSVSFEDQDEFVNLKLYGSQDTGILQGMNNFSLLILGLHRNYHHLAELWRLITLLFLL